MKKYISIIFTITVFFTHASAQVLKGVIRNTTNEIVPFATVYVPSISKGAISNSNGEYEIELPTGTYQVVFQYLGYQRKTVQIQIQDEDVYQDIQLSEQQYKIRSVTISATGEDPAYYIMRKAIGMAPYYLNQVSNYECMVYVKGTGVMKEIPRILEKKLREEGLEEGKPFVTENITKLSFELPDKVKQEVISVRSSGQQGDADPMDFIAMSLYQPFDDGPVSPIDRRAFQVYKFELEGSFESHGRIINKIKVIPKRSGYDVFSGYIYIAEDYWNIHSADLHLEQKMFSLNLRVLYEPVYEQVWMPVSYDFDVSVNAMGFEVGYKYIASINEYDVTLNDKANHEVLEIIEDRLRQYRTEESDIYNEQQKTKQTVEEQKPVSKRQQKIEELMAKDELKTRESVKLARLMAKEAETLEEEETLEIVDNMTVTDSAKNRSLTYWEQNRPVPLTLEERESFNENDSTVLEKAKEGEVDTVITEQKRFKLKYIWTGRGFSIGSEKSFYMRVDGIGDLTDLSYNTVDGITIKKDINISKSWDTGQLFRLSTSPKYAIARQRYMQTASASFRYNGLKRAYVGASGGRTSLDFNSANGIHPFMNMAYTLVTMDNYLKLYEKDYINIWHRTDIANGMYLRTSFEYNMRRQLSNNADFHLFPSDGKEFTPNIPAHPDMSPERIANYEATILNMEWNFTPKSKYRMRNNVKVNYGSSKPSYWAKYTQGLNNIFNSSAKHSYFEFGLADRVGLGLMGSMRYRVRTGFFLNADDLHFTDYEHFNTFEPVLIMAKSVNSFYLLDYYENSTNKAYIEAHANISDNVLLLKRLPILNKTLIQENVLVNYLMTPDLKNYIELGYGLSMIFLMFDVHGFVGFENGKYSHAGFKVSLPFENDSDGVSIGF